MTAVGESFGGGITSTTPYLTTEGLGLTTGNTIYVLGGVDPDTQTPPSTHSFVGSTMISMEPPPPLTNLTSLHFNHQMHGIGDQSQFSPANTPPGSQVGHAPGITDIHGAGGGGSMTPDNMQIHSTPHSLENSDCNGQDTKRKRK